MAGGSSNTGFFNNSKPAKGTTEKKKRKRPSKKVPTTVLDSSSENFMTLVQKLTGSADEVVAAREAENRRASGVTDAPNSRSPSPYASPYSSPSAHAQHDSDPHLTSHHTRSESYYPQYHQSSRMAGYQDFVDGNPSSHGNYNSASYSSLHNTPSYDHHQATSSSGYNYNSGGGGYLGSHQPDDDYNRHCSGRSHDTSDDYGPSSSSRALEYDNSPHAWRSDQMNHSCDYWYSADQVATMRA
ncbi:uncharacterized protein [Physcomitrium patens]|uniref:VQ domain-containing protein n=1 Tax=Physcomitrium patens TaxID=3218 RepID=A9TCV5_PHYPA|nr:putative uncharacterized protein DDB_G0272516 [Physcomitrium patens]XP_024396268.1 putative uncharacterized protein DDB_G0272516 [Physcomitrium patens]PNR39659.1 hypothetical protein PHYPA_019938 [Physcomitrium patens]|eukprot:XP_024396267.1 putative uncharacterized protein DDB_G0272516 [Physcomitrella patens]